MLQCGKKITAHYCVDRVPALLDPTTRLIVLATIIVERPIN